MRYVLAFPAVGFALLVTGCGGSSTGASTSSPTTYSVGGKVSGLNGSLILQNNGADTLTLAANGDFAFPTTLPPGSAYAVTIQTQPTNQTCSITSGDASGTLSASVSVQIQCTSSTAVTNQWMWRGGANYVGAPGTYGTLGASSAANTPGARRRPTAWSDASGNFWLFGGYGTAGSTGTAGMLDDLWEYVPPSSSSVPATSGVWTWQAGSNGVAAAASYGSLGVANVHNDPGAREGAASWRDAAGNLWLFGGDALSGQGSAQFNDVWEFNLSSANWIWQAGSSTADDAGSYGTQGVALSANLPPARTGAITWTDSAGVFWLFGGAELNTNGSIAAVFNDLWSFNPQTLLWTWVSGPSSPDSPGAYGTEGTAASGNLPPARMSGNAWVDSSGNAWIFGGLGLSAANISQQYGDLWEYNPGSGEWTWVSGSHLPNTAGTYGTLGTGAAGNTPGGRASSVAWTDHAGKFWLFGGYGYDAQGAVNNLNDLWEFDPSSDVWTWVSGSSLGGASGNYGQINTSVGSNVPGARQQAVGWVDSGGNFWLLGGFGFDALANQQNLNDLWSYTPTP